jgi:predicted DCC family thiol-disulfide oxidoreductase YuxK
MAGIGPRLYYDSDCGFCSWMLALVLRWDRSERLRVIAIQSPEGERDLGDLGAARFDAWHLIRDGERYSGGLAFAPLLEELPGGRLLARAARTLEFMLVPGYRLVAKHRGALSRLVPARSKARADALVISRTDRAEATEVRTGS